MSASTVRQHRRHQWLLWLMFGAGSVVVAFVYVSYNVVREAGFQETKPAHAIVVFGAAEYAGRPSPVYRARLDRAFELYAQRLAPVIITTGGAGGDPSYNEGQVGHDYLMRLGVPETSLIAETQGNSTAESARRVGVILRANHMRTCLAVSDEYHVFRVRKMLEREGAEVYVAPRPDSRPRTVWQRTLSILREATSYLLWRLHIPT